MRHLAGRDGDALVRAVTNAASLFTDPLRGAIIDGSGLFRYRLWRALGQPAEGRVLFVMLNPSTADASVDDPTIRRCIGFARRWGAGALDVVNLYALRATDPGELRRAADPVGPDNDRHIVEAAREASIIVCAWGAHPFARRRAAHVSGLLRAVGTPLECLHVTADGSPRHPLYVRGATSRVEWPPSPPRAAASPLPSARP